MVYLDPQSNYVYLSNYFTSTLQTHDLGATSDEKKWINYPRVYISYSTALLLIHYSSLVSFLFELYTQFAPVLVLITIA